MYEMADQSWRRQPRAMPDEIADLAAQRIAEHARSHGLDRVTLILHGGEPLLAGRDLITRLIEGTRCQAGPGITVDASVQTNAVGLSDAYLRLFDELDIGVGVSVDGDATAHDRHRRFASGRGSYAAVTAALGRLQRFPHLYRGLLATIDLRNDPVQTYEALAGLGPPRLDFLLPHGTWAQPPPGRVPDPSLTPYADWLTAVFDHWYPRPRTRIRLFEEIMRLLLGGVSNSEMVGLAPARMVVIETDGSIEQEDTLKIAFDGAPATGLHISRGRCPRNAGPVPSIGSAVAGCTRTATARVPGSRTFRFTALISWLSLATSAVGCTPTSPPGRTRRPRDDRQVSHCAPGAVPGTRERRGRPGCRSGARHGAAQQALDPADNDCQGGPVRHPAR
jgi:hypothetical protein